MAGRSTPARIVATLAFCAPAWLGAQALRGTVVDSVSRLPVPGVVVSVVDTSGGIVGRALSDQRGNYFIYRPSAGTRIRALRIGFRPRELPLPVASNDELRVDFRMLAIPTFLEPLVVASKQCPRRPDSERASGLWEQARTGLLATIVAREQYPATLVRTGYRRELAVRGERLVSQSVTVDSVEGARNSYKAEFRADEFLRLGFQTESEAVRIFYAPDAETLLDPAFSDGYCFRIAPRDRARRGQVGLGFTAAERVSGRVDIEGTLWVDTVARALRDIEFTYRNVGRLAEAHRPGGTVSFAAVSNGVTFVDAWQLRVTGTQAMPFALRGARPDTKVTGITLHGGEVVRARWPDGARYDARLGSLEMTAMGSNGLPAAGGIVTLEGTPFRAVVDSTGAFAMKDLLPGRYRLLVGEPRLDSLALEPIATRAFVTVERGAVTRARVTIPTLESWLAERCARDVRTPRSDGPPPARHVVIARLFDADRRPVGGADLTLGVPDASRGDGWAAIHDPVRTSSDGVFAVCSDALQAGQPVAITVRRGAEELGRVERTLSGGPVTLIAIFFK